MEKQGKTGQKRKNAHSGPRMDLIQSKFSIFEVRIGFPIEKYMVKLNSNPN